MAVSLDTLLAAQSNKAQSITKRLDSARSAFSAKSDDDFSRYIEDAPEPLKEPLKQEAQEFKPQVKKLDDYRKEARSEVEEVVEQVSGKFSEVEQADVQVKEEGASQQGEVVVLDAAKEVVATILPDEVQVKTAQERGIENIQNVALTGVAKGEVATNPADASAPELLARGGKIIESQRQVGALIVNQLQGTSTTAGGLSDGDVAAQQLVFGQFPVAASLGLSGQQEVVSLNSGVDTPVRSQAPQSAVNVARQSKLVAQQVSAESSLVQLEDATSKQVATVNHLGENPVLAQQTVGKSAEQLIVKLDDLKGLASKQLQHASSSEGVAVDAKVSAQQVAAEQVRLGQQQNGQSQSQQQQSGKSAAVQQVGAGISAEGTKDLDGLLSNKSSAENIKTDASQIIDSPKFKEYMKLVEVQGNARTHTNQGADKAESVLAQIKFGMAAAAAKGEKHISIQLYPKELGTVDVHMKISASKGAEITVVAEKSETASMLQREAQSLKEALNDALKNQNTQLNFSFREEGNGQGKSMGSPFNGKGFGQDLIEGAEEAIPPLRQMHLSMERGVNLVI